MFFDRMEETSKTTGLVRWKAGRGWDKRRRNRAKATSKLLKSAWGMPRLLEARKDVTSCEKPRGGANSH